MCDGFPCIMSLRWRLCSFTHNPSFRFFGWSAGKIHVPYCLWMDTSSLKFLCHASSCAFHTKPIWSRRSMRALFNGVSMPFWKLLYCLRCSLIHVPNRVSSLAVDKCIILCLPLPSHRRLPRFRAACSRKGFGGSRNVSQNAIRGNALVCCRGQG
jgi:hypothetical protein